MSLLAAASRPARSIVARRCVRHLSSTASAPGAVLAPFAGAATSANSMHTPHPAPISHAPVAFSKNQERFQVDKQEYQKSAEEYIAEVPVIEVNGPTAICDGGDPRLGHPIEFIQLNKVRPDEPSTCKYCGLRFIMAHGHHGGH